SERAEIERLSDGSVEVRLYGESTAGGAPLAVSPSPPAGAVRAGATAGAMPYFQRRFMPGETREIRVYMQGGDDVVRVTGHAEESIRVRVLGGGGDDDLVDSSTVARGGWATRFYTAHGDD